MMATAAALLLVTSAGRALADGPVVWLDLPTMGPQYGLGTWLQGALEDEELQVRWPDFDEEGPLEDAPACVMTWSRPGRPGGEMKQLRGQVRGGGGIVYVIGQGEGHVRQARSFWGPLDVTIEEAEGESGFASWAVHPLTEGGAEIGAVTRGTIIRGVGGSPLITVAGSAVAMAFDWGPLGRAVIIDQSVLFGSLHQQNPRPALREFLVRAVVWAAQRQAEGPEETGRPRPAIIPEWDVPPEELAVEPPRYMRAVVDLPESRDEWPYLRPLIVEELERADLETDVPRAREGEPLITPGELERAGMLVVGSGREEVHYTEPLTVGWFFNRGGRLLFVARAVEGTQRRMIGFNQLLSQLRIAMSLGRHGDGATLVEHPITDGITLPGDRPYDGGAQIWAPLTDPLVTIAGRPCAVAWQCGQGRVVVLDGTLLIRQQGAEEPYREMRRLLRHCIEWLLGER